MAKEKKSSKKASLGEYVRVMASRAGLRFSEEELEVVARMHHEGALALRAPEAGSGLAPLGPLPGLAPMAVVYKAD